MVNILENKGAMTATIVVAAADSLNIAAANYVCSGAADDVEIQAALLAGAGGRVVLLEGNYITAQNITVPDDTCLEGCGFGTVITPTGAAIGGAANGAIEMGNRSKLKDMKVILAAGCGAAGTRPNVVMANGKTMVWIEDCWIVGDTSVADDASEDRQNGIYWDTVTHSKIINCRVEDNDKHGVRLIDASNYNTIEGNTCQGNSNVGVWIINSDNNSIVSNICQGNGGIGTYINSSDNNTITRNICEGNGSVGTYLLMSHNNTVMGNTCQGNRWGIRAHDSTHNTIAGNTCQGNTEHGIYLTNASTNNTITGNTCADNDSAGNTYSGIEMESSNENVITGNQCDSNGLHGIYIFRSSYSVITGNSCHNQNTGDGINITGDATTNSDYNTLTGNTCHGNGSNGIEIAGGADANKNIVGGNELTGNTAASLVDGGNNSVLGHNVT